MCAADTLPIEGTRVNWVDELPAELPGAVRFGPYLQVCPGDALFVWPRVARFRVREGRQIDIQIAEGGDKKRAAELAHNAPFGALVHQRGELPLHASAVTHPRDGRTLLIAGASGAGKSTTAAAFARRGWKVLNDDLSRLTVAESGTLVWPGFHALKLWGRSCRLLELDASQLPAVYEAKRKYLWSSGKVEGPRVASAIVELHCEGEGEMSLTQSLGSAAIEMLLRQTFRPKLIRALGIGESHFARVAQVARRTPCFRLHNPHAVAPLVVASRIEALIG